MPRFRLDEVTVAAGKTRISGPRPGSGNSHRMFWRCLTLRNSPWSERTSALHRKVY